LKDLDKGYTNLKDERMNISKIITGLLLSILLGSGVAVAADYDKGLKAAESGDFKTALAEWTPLAEQGDADAQFNLGLMYANGYGVPENDKTSVKWYTKAAEQGYASAQLRLGSMYDFGKGVPKSYKTAVKWYTLAAEQGNARAQDFLGGMYQTGSGVLQNHKTAVKWYKKAAEHGDASAQSSLGYMYSKGHGVLKDNRRAYMWHNLSSYNGLEQIGGRYIDKIAKKMTLADISKAQDMSSRCLESNYTDC
jgi:TPR repeat protein